MNFNRHAQRFDMNSGIFCLKNLPPKSVVGKYEGHRIHGATGKIIERCPKTDILFTYRHVVV
jgi:hypothetical protein